MTGKIEIQWSPIRDRFITWGSEISLFEILPSNIDVNSNSPKLRISNTLSANLLATNTNYHYVKCIDIHPKSQSDLLLAIGLTNGRVVLTYFGPCLDDNNGAIAKELVAISRHGRHCNGVSFNPLEHNLLAAGLDRFRSDPSVLVWDVTKYANPNNRLHSYSTAGNSEAVRFVRELGPSEGANSLAWFNTNSKLLACGMNQKSIRLFDIRDQDNTSSFTATKAVYGLCVDHNDKRMASYVDNQVYIWDLRSFDKPVVVLSNNRLPVLKINWSPTKYNVLGVLHKDSSSIHLHSIQETTVTNEEMEPAVLERIITPGLTYNIASFSFHSYDENRFLAMDAFGTITDYTVFDRITLNSSPNGKVIWTLGRKTMKFIDDSQVDDISNKMKERARKGYGLENDVHLNAKMVEQDEILANVWNWIHLSGKLVEDGIIVESSNKHPGIFSLLPADPETIKSEMITINWVDLGYTNCQGSARFYRHEVRDNALNLCSWPNEKDPDSLNKYVDHLTKASAFTRAAAIAVFNLKLKTAIEILSKSPNNNEMGSSLHVVAMALAGFSDDKNSVWRQFCSEHRNQLNDPYLKAIFAFLTTENHNYDHVLSDSRLTVDDRVAFACKFLSDNKLYEYLKKLDHQLKEEGNLDGLLLTGNCPDGLKLLQKYLDHTSDIQSTALIAVRAFFEYLHFERVKDWIEDYRNLLDTWKFWYQRADFDIMLARYRSNEKPPQQVYVSCNFCGKSISAFMHGLSRGRGAYTRLTGTPNKVKLTSCPNCRKPLPRCSICLMYMGTSIGEDEGGAEFANWFTWCQSCRHGGHAGHVMEWFECHHDCPVTGCSCKCLAIDFPSVSST